MWWIIKKQTTRKRRRPNSTSDAHYRKYKAQARKVIIQRVSTLARRCDITYGRIAIRNTCTRWGSCSSRGNLNFHYGLLFLPPRVRDYVIIHELCHLTEMNHSAAFWRLVEHRMPDYREQRRALRTFSPERIARCHKPQ